MEFSMKLDTKILKNLSQKICKYTQLVEKENILFTKPTTFKNINAIKLNFADKIGECIPILDNTNPDIAYHGSPFNFNFFDANKIGSGEGISKRGKGLYLHRSKRLAPFYANIRSKDAPPHIGCNDALNITNPHIYATSGINSLNLKQVSEHEAKNIAKIQSQFETTNPHIDGLELKSGEICIFPNSIPKLHIKKKDSLESFVSENKGFDFREWTTDKSRLAQLA